MSSSPDLVHPARLLGRIAAAIARDVSPSPAWHNNLRRARRRARRRLLAAALSDAARAPAQIDLDFLAARRLAKHHGSAPPKMPGGARTPAIEDAGGRRRESQRGGASPRPSIRLPVWGCNCGEHSNYASRATCRGCGRDAPRTIRDRQSRQLEGRAPLVPSRPSPGRSDGNKELIELRRGLRALRNENQSLRSTEQVASQDAPMAHSETAIDLVKLQQSIEVSKAAVGGEHPSVLALQATLDHERTRRREALPISARIHDTEARVKRLGKAATSAAATVADKQNACDKAAQALQTAKDQLAAKQAEHRAAEEELRTLRLHQVAAPDVPATQAASEVQAQAAASLRNAVGNDPALLAAVAALIAPPQPAPAPAEPLPPGDDLQRVIEELRKAACSGLPEHDKVARALDVVTQSLAKRRRGPAGDPVEPAPSS